MLSPVLLRLQGESASGSEGMLVDHLPPRRNRGRKVAKIEVAAAAFLTTNFQVQEKQWAGTVPTVFFCSLTLCRLESYDSRQWLLPPNLSGRRSCTTASSKSWAVAGWAWCMGMAKRKRISPETLDASLVPKQRKPIPHAFVLDAISTLSPYTRPMFGCLAIYVKDKIVLILRDKPKSTADNGVWLATTQEHHQSLRREFPNMRSIQVLGKRVTGWQVLPVDAPDFESAALRACELVLAGDPRIGKIPGARTSKSGSKATGRSSKQIKTSKKHGSTINFDAKDRLGIARRGREHSLRVTRAQGS
jgi:hypothetical protein